MNLGRSIPKGLIVVLVTALTAAGVMGQGLDPALNPGPNQVSVPVLHGARGDVLPKVFGTVNVARIQVPAASFTMAHTDCGYASVDNTGYFGPALRYGAFGGCSFFPMNASFSLPSGALITGIEVDFRNNSTTDTSFAALVACDYHETNCTQYTDTSAVGPIGDTYDVIDLTSTPITVDNYLNKYTLYWENHDTSGNIALAGMIVYYFLQVSPAPSVASFVDVPTTSPLFRFVEALKAAGITGGCDATHFCPNNPLTRGQMAVFLSAGLGLSWN
jgi:hypothetical protein